MTGIVESPINSVGSGELRIKVNQAGGGSMDMFVETWFVFNDNEKIFYYAAKLRATCLSCAFLGSRFEGLLDFGNSASLWVKFKTSLFQEFVDPKVGGGFFLGHRLSFLFFFQWTFQIWIQAQR